MKRDVGDHILFLCRGKVQGDVSVVDREVGGEVGDLSIKKKSRKCLLPAPDRPQYCAAVRLVGDVLIVYADIPKVLQFFFPITAKTVIIHAYKRILLCERNN